jgi:hypothetical protein
VAKAKSDEMAASSAQRRRDKLASLEAARKKEQIVRDLLRACDCTAGLPGLFVC